MGYATACHHFFISRHFSGIVKLVNALFASGGNAIDMKYTKEQILTKIRSGTDFPVMSSTMALINKLDASSDSSVAELSNIILNDHALISKILKLVNSVNYVEFGEVTTISRAIVLLGFESIKNLAMTLLLFDHFRKNGSVDVIDAIVKSIYSGTLAKKIAGDLSFVDSEEAFICALFHTFGRMIAGSYLPEEFRELQRLISEDKFSESAAAASTIGMSFEELGITIARDWNFPVRITQSMKKMRPAETSDTTGDVDRLCSIANFSNEVSSIIASGGHDTDRKLDDLMKAYQRQFGSLQNTFNDLLAATFQDITAFAHVFNIKLNAMPFAKQLLAWSSGEVPEVAAPSVLGIESAALKTIDSLADTVQEVSPEVIFISGIQEMNNSLIQNHPLNDIIRISLETAYRGLSYFGKAKTLFFIKDTRQPIMAVRFGFGSDIEETSQWFRIPLSEQDNFFNLAISKQTDLVIKDIEAPDISKLVPAWYREKAGGGLYVIVLPIVVNTKPIGLFYAEGARDSLAKISGGQLKYLTILRDTTVLAIKQRQG